MSKKIKLLFYITTLFFTEVALAQMIRPSEDIERDLLEDNIVLSEWLNGVAEGLDLFLAGKKLTRRKNETSVRIDNSSYMNEKTPLDIVNSTSLGVNLRLPNLEEYWQLKFTSYDETKEKGAAQRGNLRRTPRERDYGASLGLFRKLGRVRTAFQPRVSLGNRFSVSHSLAFESMAEYEKYQFNPKIDFFANPNEGTGIFIAGNFHANISKVYGFTFINDGTYKDKLNLFTATNGFALSQTLNRISSLTYNLILISTNQSGYHLEDYNLSVTWGRIIYKNILDMQLTPILDFSKETSFTGAAGLALNLGLNF